MADQNRFSLKFRRFAALVLALCCLLPAAAFADDDTAALYAQRLEELQTPAEAAIAEGCYQLRTGNSAYFPYVSPGVIPFDQQEETPLPAPEGTFSSRRRSFMSVVLPAPEWPTRKTNSPSSI